MPKRKSSQSSGAVKGEATSSRFKSRAMFAALKTKFSRNRTGSVDGDPGDKLPEFSVTAKCATLPARVSSLEPQGNKSRTLYWMVDAVGELENSLPGSSIVTREDSEESVDSGFHQVPKVEESETGLVPATRTGSNNVYDVATVEKAFGPLKDVGRWYSTYSTTHQLGEGRYVHRPVRLQHSLDEDERLTSRPLPPIPGVGVSHTNQQPEIVPHDLVYERVEPRMIGSNGLCLGLRDLSHHGWYWGPITRIEAEERLAGTDDGTFLVRDSSDDRYLLSLSFRSQGKTLHTRIEYSNGYFSFYSFPDSDTEGYQSVVELIENSMEYSQGGVFCFSRARALGSPAVPVRLLKPFSRFNHVRSLQHYCRFVVRQSIRFDLIRQLPLPGHVHGFLEQSQF